jgi:hypothetical protein
MNAVAPRSQKMMRLVSELGSLSISLPLALESSIFVRCDENRIDVMKAIIVGTLIVCHIRL